jgi:cellulose synthase/poly-beta-1,6-N-acetylglucosamine synthase-like glycosyltransferase
VWYDLAVDTIRWFNYLVIGYYVAANGIYGVFVWSSIGLTMRHLIRIRYGRYDAIAEAQTTPPVSVLVPAHNEEANIVQTVRALLTLNYPAHELIVINDGSTDGTLKRLIDEFQLRPVDLIYRRHIPTEAVRRFYTNPYIPGLTVLDKRHGGKADALNAGINVARAPYFCSVDADSILEHDALVRLVRPIVESPDPNAIVAVGGIVRVANGSEVQDGRISKVALPRDAISMLQIVEYLRSFLVGRTGWGNWNSLLVISGAFSLLHKRTVMEAGGYDTDSVTEDMELVIRLHRLLLAKRRPYRIEFVQDPICWTEAPTTLKMLARQRRRWHRGMVESLFVHRGMFFNPRYRQIGWFAAPYHLFIESLGPVIELGGYLVVALSYALGLVDTRFLLLFFVLSILVGVFFSVSAIVLEEMSYRRYVRWRDFLRLIAYGVLENFGYRQLLAWWRLQALAQLVTKRRWEYVRKRGFQKKESRPTAAVEQGRA